MKYLMMLGTLATLVGCGDYKTRKFQINTTTNEEIEVYDCSCNKLGCVFKYFDKSILNTAPGSTPLACKTIRERREKND